MSASTRDANPTNRSRKPQPQMAEWFSPRPREVGHKRTDPSLLSTAACRSGAWSRGTPTGHEYAWGRDLEGIGEKQQPSKGLRIRRRIPSPASSTPHLDL